MSEGLQADRQRNKIRTWLSPPDPTSNFNKARDQRHEGTGQWLLESDQYTKWKTERNSFLWLNGVAGCGKTIISSTIIADLQQEPVTSPNLLYFYFDFNDVEKQSHENAVRSMIDQLYYNRTDLQEEVDTVYSSCGNGISPLDSTSLFKLFQGLVQRAGEPWIVLDALDECLQRSKGFAGGLLSWIRGLRDASSAIHILVTSRPEQDIQAAIESWAHAEEVISLKSGHIGDDIKAYIKAQTRTMSRWQNRPDIQDKIETTLVEKSDGM